jgi:hypothetical protein
MGSFVTSCAAERFLLLRMTTQDGCHRDPGLERRETWGTRSLEEEFEKEKTGWLPVFLKAES